MGLKPGPRSGLNRRVLGVRDSRSPSTKWKGRRGVPGRGGGPLLLPDSEPTTTPRPTRTPSVWVYTRLYTVDPDQCERRRVGTPYTLVRDTSTGSVPPSAPVRALYHIQFRCVLSGLQGRRLCNQPFSFPPPSPSRRNFCHGFYVSVFLGLSVTFNDTLEPVQWSGETRRSNSILIPVWGRTSEHPYTSPCHRLHPGLRIFPSDLTSVFSV